MQISCMALKKSAKPVKKQEHVRFHGPNAIAWGIIIAIAVLFLIFGLSKNTAILLPIAIAVGVIGIVMKYVIKRRV